jgi:hypothetical protein
MGDLLGQASDAARAKRDPCLCDDTDSLVPTCRAAPASRRLRQPFGPGCYGVRPTQSERPRYPITTLQVDRSLVECLQEEDTSAVLRGVVLLAGCLGIDVLAEGIKTPAQQERLTAPGVGLGQGFWFAPPLAAADVPDGSIGGAPAPWRPSPPADRRPATPEASIRNQHRAPGGTDGASSPGDGTRQCVGRW